MTLDWAYLANLKGSPLESLIARWLARKYPDARQVQPGNHGDGGIDIYRKSPDGLVVWQVKGFTAPLTSSQWGQIRDSWERFRHEHVEKGEKVSSYALVTPWTPTLARQEEFDGMTEGVAFPCYWHADAWLQALDSEFPDVTARWLHGDQALDQQVMAKAVVASQPLAEAEKLSFPDALKARSHALDNLWEQASDNYHVDIAYRTTNPGEKPMPLPGQAGVLHRFEQVGQDRWFVQSVVPRGSGSGAAEPMRLTMNFAENVGTDREQGVRDWLEWGIAITEPTPVILQQIGGPFADPEPVARIIDHAFLGDPNGDRLPTFEFELAVSFPDGERVAPMRLVEHSVGAVTGWMRWVLETSGGLMRFEVRYTGVPDSDRNSTLIQFQSTGGRPLLPLAEEAELLDSTTPTTASTIRTTTGLTVVRMTGHVAAGAIEDVHELLSALVLLQEHSDKQFLAPELAEITGEEARTLVTLRDIYDGEPHESAWARGTLPPLGEQAAGVVLDGAPFSLRQPRGVACGGQNYLVTHPLVHHLYSAVSESGRANADAPTDIAPGEDNRQVFYADPDWKRAG